MMHSVPVLLLVVILLGSMMDKPHANNNNCDCQGRNQACMSSCKGFKKCMGCAKHFQDCITSSECRRRRGFASFLRTGTETAKQDDKQREFSSMEAAVGNIRRKWMPLLEKQQPA